MRTVGRRARAGGGDRRTFQARSQARGAARIHPGNGARSGDFTGFQNRGKLRSVRSEGGWVGCARAGDGATPALTDGPASPVQPDGLVRDLSVFDEHFGYPNRIIARSLHPERISPGAKVVESVVALRVRLRVKKQAGDDVANFDRRFGYWPGLVRDGALERPFVGLR